MGKKYHICVTSSSSRIEILPSIEENGWYFDDVIEIGRTCLHGKYRSQPELICHFVSCHKIVGSSSSSFFRWGILPSTLSTAEKLRIDDYKSSLCLTADRRRGLLLLASVQKRPFHFPIYFLNLLFFPRKSIPSWITSSSVLHEDMDAIFFSSRQALINQLHS